MQLIGELTEHTGSVNAIVCTNDGSRLFSADAVGQIKGNKDSHIYHHAF
jgi:hypothetical protein